MLLVSSSVKAAPAAVVAATPGAPAGDPNDPKAPHASGIYYYEEVDGKQKMTQVDPARVEDISTGSGFGIAWGGTAKTRAVLAGAHAPMQTKQTEPVFYFYFAKTDTSLGSVDVAATSPDDFSLAIMEAHTSNNQPVRRLEISKVSLGGSHAGLNQKDIRTFTSEKIGDGIYKVTTSTLKPGEYVFAQLMGARVATALKMFDFGVTK